MKHKLIKIFGLGLTFVLVVGMLFGAAPVSAGELDWGTFSPFPSTTGYVIANATDVVDLAVSDDGVMYALTGADNFIYKSTNGGRTWTQLSKNFSTVQSFVAVSMDDSNMLAVANSTDVQISTNGGSTFGDLNADTAGVGTIRDLAVSADDAGHNFVGVAAGAVIWYFEVGAAAPSWRNTSTDPGWMSQASALAVNFSPNIASDKVMVGVTTGAGANTSFQVYSLNTNAWNTPFGSGYPVRIQNDSTDITDATMARIAMSPDYLGSDDSLRNVFVGISATTSNNAGVYRIKDDSDKAIDTDDQIYSIDYDGTNLIAGDADGSVHRSDNPMGSDPDFSSTSNLKLPGRSSTTTPQSNVVVAWRGADVVAGTTGFSSAFAVSMDNGASFNDISFIDAAAGTLGTLMDVAVSPDGSVIYMLADDANATSLFRYMDGAWQRVMAIETGGTFIVRTAPDDPDSIYMAQTGSGARTIYYSQAAGDEKIFQRTARYDIQDMAVESSDVLYIAIYGASTVSRSTNSGFTWGSADETEVTGGAIHSIASLGEDEVIVGSDQGYVAWSTDGGDSWDKINKQLNSGVLTQVTASGLSTGDFIYAATSTTGSRVERWEIGQSGTSWKNLEAPTNSTMGAYGIALSEGVLYVQTANATNSETLRTLSPTDSEPSAGMWSVAAEAASFNAAPRSLWLSTGSTTLWSVNTVVGSASLYSFLDKLTAAGPTIVGPADGFEVKFNTVSGNPFDVALTWQRLSKATIYDYQVSLDSSFNEKIFNGQTSSTTASTPSVVLNGNDLDPETTYYWRVRVNIAGPVRSAWSEVRTFTVGELPPIQPPITIPPQPTPTITVPQPTITVPPPTITLPPQPAPTTITIPPAPTPAPAVPTWTLIVIIVIGGVLVIVVIILIMRTRRPM